MDVVSDTKMTEVTSSEMMGWKTVKVTREVKGNTMICVSLPSIVDLLDISGLAFRDRRGRVVVGFTTTCVISACHH
jgi:hypothetical protein